MANAGREGGGARERARMAAGASEVEILKPRCDKREYRRIVLPNSLEALIISDPETDKAAASMNVSVGSFSDPDGLEGLAHFLEHMLFYASKKYPIEDSYSKFITEHGGSRNAYTASEHTNYHFDVNVDSFEEALDRFAQFFISPLMSPDATLREIKAVHSENQKNLLSDVWRMSQLQKHLSSRNHPYHKFGTGNWNTLEVQPKLNGLDTRLELLKFYKKNYSANLMHLVVYAREGLDAIQSLVEQKFCDIQNSGQNYSYFPGQPCSSEHLQILVKAVRIKQGHKLRVVWPIAPSIRNYKEGPCRYLSHLIGHEGEGSVFFVLKQLGWALSLEAGEGDWSLEFSFFSVSIELTDKGHEHIEDIVGILFRYIDLLQNSGVNKWIFDELVAISETQFHYQDKISPCRYVVNIASNIQNFPPEDWLVRWSLPSNFVPSTIQTILDELTPENIRMFWESKNFEGCTDLVEPWYGTSYSVEKVPVSIIKQWIAKAPEVDLHLPKQNVFIPSDLTIKNAQEKQVKYPILLRTSSFSRLWYKPDTMFSMPKAYIKVEFNCPQSIVSPEAEVLTYIFTKLLIDYLNEYAYYAKVAGLYYAIYNTRMGFEVIVVGYNDKMRILLETIVGRIEQFEVKPDRFFVIKESITKKYENFKFQKPFEQARHYSSLLLEDNKWPWNEKLEVLPHLEADHLSKFSNILLEKAFLEFYIAGNIEPREADSIAQHIEDILFKSTHSKCKPLFPSQHLASRIIKLEEGLRYYYPTEVFNIKDENSALIHYTQIHQDEIKLNVRLQLFALIAKQAAFHQLRTVEQLGYITMLTQRNDSGTRGVQIIIQSSVKDPLYLEARVDAFLEKFGSKLHEMTNEEYKNYVNALIDMKLEKFKNLWEESAFYWREIVDGTLKFDRVDSEVAALKELDKDELIDYFNKFIKIDSPQRKTLCVLVYGGPQTAEYKKVIQQEDTPKLHRIKDIFAFRRSRPLFGSFKGGLGLTKL
ncbi:insulin-degrading enzyme-like 1, peroxisomal isoform X3 [Zingiber officinale]|uniref:insulin-degrading enzyme-like 1, peroxisomal isoform X3 n=1 Tax=Zingiber officinale TaxID=94328 RepID=UPI001C4C901C|nr:insulin-degrading enzyme-like 1, peroxisomal isoform X3 [Zingiber officinale]